MLCPNCVCYLWNVISLRNHCSQNDKCVPVASFNLEASAVGMPKLLNRFIKKLNNQTSGEGAKHHWPIPPSGILHHECDIPGAIGLLYPSEWSAKQPQEPQCFVRLRRTYSNAYWWLPSFGVRYLVSEQFDVISYHFTLCSWVSQIFSVFVACWGVCGFFAFCSWISYKCPAYSAANNHEMIQSVRFLLGRFRLDVWWYGVPLLLRGRKRGCFCTM